MKQDAKSILLEKDRFSYVDAIALLDKGGEVSHCSEKGIIVSYEVLSSVVCFSGWQEMTPFIEDLDLVCVHDEGLRNWLISHRGYKNEEGCRSFSWWKGRPAAPDGDFRTLDLSFLGRVSSVYRLADEKELASDLEKGNVFGLFIEGELAGFIGFHPEGSMGMLHVFDSYRRQGLGEKLERYDILTALSRNMIPYCHVFFSNEASLALQRKLGLSEGEKPVWWLWKD